MDDVSVGLCFFLSINLFNGTSLLSVRYKNYSKGVLIIEITSLDLLIYQGGFVSDQT